MYIIINSITFNKQAASLLVDSTNNKQAADCSTSRQLAWLLVSETD